MRPVLVAWLVRHGLPVWAAPDYVTMVVVAAVVGGLLVLRLAARDGARIEVQTRALLIAYVAALLGGYLFEQLRALPTAVAQRSLLPITAAGRAAYGGLLFGLCAPIVYLRRCREPCLAFLDRATIVLGIAYGAVRTGCFLEGCDYGMPTRAWVGVRFPAGSLAAEAHAYAGFVPHGAPSLPVHPTQLYEAALGIVATILAQRPLARGERNGRAIAVWLVTYAVGRFVIELWRGDVERGIALGFSTAQWVSLGLVLAVAAVTLGVRLTTRVGPTSRRAIAIPR